MKVPAGSTLAAVFVLATAMAGGVLGQAPTPPPGGARGAQPPGGAGAPPAIDGAALFKDHCASCHDPAVNRAQTKAELGQSFPEAVRKALKAGVMQPMAAGLSDDDIDAIALHLTGRAPKPLGDFSAEDKNRCPAGSKFVATGPSWNGWSPDVQNTRYQPNPGLKAADVPKLKVKWAFAIEGGRYGQPSPVGNRVFVTASSGRVYSLDGKTGCVAWAFTSPVGVRTAPSVTPNKAAASGYAVYFGDYDRNVYALDANSGEQLWRVSVEKHARAVLTGAPVTSNGVLYVPVSSWEEVTGGLAIYPCCTFRGSVVAIDVATGAQLWKTYMIQAQAKPYRKNSAGTELFGPAGSAIWSTPTLDLKRGLVYVATGNNYTDLDDGGMSDAVVALDMKTGAIRWKTQVSENDKYVMGCFAGSRNNAINCPATTIGPDADFGASPILKTVGGKDVLLAGQKSAVVHAFDPDTGKILWQKKVGQGSALGGVEWGMAADGNNVYAAVADNARGMPGLTALNITTGEQVWQVRAAAPKCGWKGRCANGYSAPPSMIPGIVFSGSQDGHLRAFDTRDGSVVWDFDTAGQTYATVNGVKAQRGGQLDGSGPTIADGRIYMISGYNGSSGNGWSDNVLLTFSVDGK